MESTLHKSGARHPHAAVRQGVRFIEFCTARGATVPQASLLLAEVRARLFAQNSAVTSSVCVRVLDEVMTQKRVPQSRRLEVYRAVLKAWPDLDESGLRVVFQGIGRCGRASDFESTLALQSQSRDAMLRDAFKREQWLALLLLDEGRCLELLQGRRPRLKAAIVGQVLGGATTRRAFDSALKTLSRRGAPLYGDVALWLDLLNGTNGYTTLEKFNKFSSLQLSPVDDMSRRLLAWGIQRQFRSVVAELEVGSDEVRSAFRALLQRHVLPPLGYLAAMSIDSAGVRDDFYDYFVGLQRSLRSLARDDLHHFHLAFLIRGQEHLAYFGPHYDSGRLGRKLDELLPIDVPLLLECLVALTRLTRAHRLTQLKGVPDFLAMHKISAEDLLTLLALRTLNPRHVSWFSRKGGTCDVTRGLHHMGYYTNEQLIAAEFQLVARYFQRYEGLLEYLDAVMVESLNRVPWSSSGILQGPFCIEPRSESELTSLTLAGDLTMCCPLNLLHKPEVVSFSTNDWGEPRPFSDYIGSRRDFMPMMDMPHVKCSLPRFHRWLKNSTTG